MNTRVSDKSEPKWRPSRFHGELDEDGEAIYFAVERADDADDITRLTTYTSPARFRELCEMFKVDATVKERADG